MKKLLATLLALVMILALAACGGASAPAAETTTPAKEASSPAEAAKADVPAAAAAGQGKTVGIAMPAQSSSQDGTIMKEQLEALGYTVDLQYAENDSQIQVSQIETMMESGAACLVISPINSQALTDVAAKAKEAGIPIISYDRLLMQTDAVSYFVSINHESAGRAIGQYVETKLELDGTPETFTMELFMGPADDHNSILLYNGIMEVIQPYLDNETLVCKSGMTALEDTAIQDLSQETAQITCENRLMDYYLDEDLDVCLTASDVLAEGCRSALENYGYIEENWPVVTGQGAELTAAKNILSGFQTMSVARDPRILAEQCAAMVNALLTGAEPEVNDTTTNDNGVIVVPSYLCAPVVADAENHQAVFVDSGLYTAEQLAN